jgi:hypothetical protein
VPADADNQGPHGDCQGARDIVPPAPVPQLQRDVHGQVQLGARVLVPPGALRRAAVPSRGLPVELLPEAGPIISPVQVRGPPRRVQAAGRMTSARRIIGRLLLHAFTAKLSLSALVNTLPPRSAGISGFFRVGWSDGGARSFGRQPPATAAAPLGTESECLTTDGRA